MVAAMKAAAIFSTVDGEAVAELARRCRRVRLRTGEMAVRAGESADRFFVILSGRVKVYKLSPKGDEQILHLYGPGQSFGDAAMWSGGEYPAFAEAVADATLLVVTRQVLHEAILASPELAMGMLGGLSRKLQEFARLIEQLSLKEVPARLAAVLLAEAAAAGSNTFRLRQSKRELAAQIGTVAETLSRALAKLKAAGLVGVRGSQIRILDADGLDRVAEGY